MDTSSQWPVMAESFTLTDLLGGAITLVIPDMQRDYDWDGEKAAAFVAGLAGLFQRQHPADKGKVTLGLIYGYSDSDDNDHVSIIDGHQRMVTLFLLLGMLYRRVQKPWLRSLLISDESLDDDFVPRIIYQSKREAFYFISDLTLRFFLDRQGRLSKLEQSDWYCKAYDSDLTVQSFIGALRSIDAVLERQSQLPSWDFEAFARFVARKMAIVYCDLGDRSDAEQMFITINTTGQPLTLPQLLRSLTLAVEADVTTAAKHWNEMEDWAWRHRPADADTSDQVLTDFLMMMAEAKRLAGDGADAHLSAAASIASMNFTKLFAAFKAYARVVQCVGSMPSEWKYPAMIMLPGMAYALRFRGKASDAQLARFCRFLSNICRYQRPAANGSDTLLAIKMAQSMPTPDILSLLEVKRISDRLLNAEERAKLQFVAAHREVRREAEQLIARAEDHPMLNGRASRLLAWCEKSADRLERLSYYIKRIYEVWGTDIDKRIDLDPVRRALLALRHQDYPMPRRGNNMYSLCWHDYDWQRLMLNSPGIVRLLIDRLDNSSLKEIAAKFTDRRYPYLVLIKDRELLANSRKRLVMRPCPPFMGVYDMSLGRLRWLVEQQELSVDPQEWTPVRAYGSRCLYADHLRLDVAVDLYYTPDDKQPYRVEIFNRPDANPDKRMRFDLKPIASSLGKARFDRRKGRFAAYYPTASAALAAIARIQSLIRIP